MITVQRIGKKAWRLSGDLSAREAIALRSAPMRWKIADDRSILFEDSTEAVDYLRATLGEDVTWIDFDPELADLLDSAQLHQVEPRRKFTFKTEPYQHQRDALAQSWNRQTWALFCEMGTGKTKILIDNIAMLFCDGQIDGALVIAPNGVHAQWIDQQIPLHLGDLGDVEVATATWRSGRKIDEDILAAQAGRFNILAMNIDAINTKKGYAAAEAFLHGHRAMMVLDESVRIKNPKAKRTKACLKLGKLAAYRRIASGAPITQGLEDLFTQCAFLDPDHLGFDSYYAYRNTFCITKPIPNAPPGAVKIVGYRNQDKLDRLVDRFATRVMKEDCLDLPDKIYVERQVELTTEQRRIYDDLRKEYYAEFGEGEIVRVDLALTMLIRLQQVVQGYLPTEEGDLVDLGTKRLDVLGDVLEETQGKAIIWARFREDIRRIRERFGGVTYYGDTSADDRTQAIEDFTQGDARLFIGNPQSAGTGLNLAVASTVVYYSNSFNADDRWQSEDRAHRIGMSGPVTYIDLVARDTMDENIVGVLRSKKDVASSIMYVKP
jgi:superfamily II DNA or RNA helicase